MEGLQGSEVSRQVLPSPLCAAPGEPLAAASYSALTEGCNGCPHSPVHLLIFFHRAKPTLGRVAEEWHGEVWLHSIMRSRERCPPHTNPMEGFKSLSLINNSRGKTLQTSSSYTTSVVLVVRKATGVIQSCSPGQRSHSPSCVWSCMWDQTD